VFLCRITIFNRYTFPGKPFIERFISLGQLLEIMGAALCFPDVYYVPGFPLNDYPRLYSMTLFLV
jgi:hypothetical protein